MNKKISKLFFIIFFGLICFIMKSTHDKLSAQNAFYNARTLANITKSDLEDLKDNVDSILFKNEKADWDSIKKFVNDPWSIDEKINMGVYYKLKKAMLADSTYTDKKKGKKNDDDESPGSIGGLGSSLLDTNFGAEFIGKALSATSEFILERAKAELSLAFFSELKKEFNEPIIIDGDTLSFTLEDIFPNIYLLIKDQQTDLMSPHIGTSLKTAFEEDLSTFYENVDKHIIPPSTKKKIEYKFLNTVFFSVNELIEGTHPANILASLSFKYPISDDEFNSGVNVLFQISESVKDTSAARIWISSNQFETMNSREIEFYLALLHQNCPEAFNNIGLKKDALKKNYAFFQKLKQTVSYLNLIDIRIRQLEDFHPNSGNDIVDALNDDDNNNPENDTNEAKMNKYKSYAYMFINLLEMINGFREENKIGSDKLEISKELADLIFAANNQEYSTVIFKTIRIFSKLDTTLTLPENMVKYATFAADIVTAESDDKIKEILENATLPVGSYRIKRNARNGVFINSYVGLGGGCEWLENDPSSHITPFAPIGLEYNKRSFSFFMSIIDLGTLVSYRWQSEESNIDSTHTQVEHLPDISFSQVFSPGLFIIYGFKNAPLSIGIGGQFSPELRKIKEIEIENGIELENEITKSAFKLSAFISVDIPLFKLYSQSD